jgi:protein-tyrosine phosphatase
MEHNFSECYQSMIDLHCHILPGIDDGAPDLDVALAMAQTFVDQGVEHVACTPHILPGLYHNTGPQIRLAVAALQAQLDAAAIPLTLVTGADNHIVHDFVDGLRRGHLLTIADSRFVLVEPPHHVAPARLEDLFFNILVAGYVPILTHPERLTWLESKYDVVQRLASKGVWMQITSGSLCGTFGRRARYWGDRMLSEGLVHILASDAHHVSTRPPDLAAGRRAAERLVGAEEATHLVVTRPRAILLNLESSAILAPTDPASGQQLRGQHALSDPNIRTGAGANRSFIERLRGLLG